MIVIANAFSMNMIPGWCLRGSVEFEVVSLDEAREIAKSAISAVGHADTAAVFSSQLETPVEASRISVLVTGEDVLLLGQYTGPRLPEGATQLPEGATIRWFRIQLR